MLLSAGNTKLVDRRENYPIYMPHNINIYVKDENSQHPSSGGLQKNISFRAFGSAQLQLRVASKKKTVATSILPIAAAGLGFSSTKSSAPRGCWSTLFKWIEKLGGLHIDKLAYVMLFEGERRTCRCDSSLARKPPHLRKHLYSHHHRDRYEHDHDPSVHGPPDNPTQLAAHNFGEEE